MQDRHDNFGGRLVLGLVHIDRNTAAVVDHGYGIVDVDNDFDLVAVTGQGLVD